MTRIVRRRGLPAQRLRRRVAYRARWAGTSHAPWDGMPRTCIAIVDATRARLFTFERIADATGIHETLSERTDLVNPARRRTPSQLFTETRPPMGRTGNLQFGLDDHRDAHIANMDAGFAREVADAIARIVRDAGARRLIVAASPRMLGALRATDLRHQGIVIDELARNYTMLTAAQIHDHLVDHGLLPASPLRPTVAAGR